MTEGLTHIVLVMSASTALSILAKATTILVLAFVALRIARRGPASVRSLVLASTFGMLLVLPIAAVLMPPVALELGAPAIASAPVGLSTGIGSLRDHHSVSPSADSAADSAQNGSPVSVRLLLMTAWATGAVLCLVPVLEMAWRLRRLRRGAFRSLNLETLVRDVSREAGVNRHLRVLVHEDLGAPFTYGIARPAILMPADALRWTDAEVRRAVIHELEHVRRADWPVHLLARVVSALYWFHPLVWIAWRRFCLESERACDDAVVGAAEGLAYAEQLVSLARRLSRPAPAPLLSMANRGDLTARVTAVLDTTQARGRVGMLCGGAMVVVAMALLAAISPLKAMVGTSAAPTHATTQKAASDSFVQASVTPHASGKSAGIPPLTNGRFTAGDLTLKDLIRIAHASPTPLLSYQVVGGPTWTDSDRFDIEAQVPADVTFGASWHPRVLAMLRALLKDRFKLEMSTETKQFPVADLVLANSDRKLGAGLRPPAGTCVDILTNPAPPPEHYLERVCGFTKVAPGLLAGKQVAMAHLAGMLSDGMKLDRVVRDRTGLEGAFDLHLEYTPDSAPAPNASSTPGVDPPPISPALLTALETQLGLRLEAKPGPVDVFVIRHAEKPTEK
jgi:bla regulator protein BlaR1